MRRAHGQGGRQGRSGLAILLVIAIAVLALALPASASADFSLTIKFAGSGSGMVECSVNGGATEACASSYAEGTEVELLPIPGTGSAFTEFTGACTGEVCELILNESKSVTAIFTHEPAEYSLEINEGGNGEGEWECLVGKEEVFCEEEFPEGTHVTVKAAPYEGSKPAVFAGDCTGSTCSLIMDKDHTVTVIFSLKEFALTVKKIGGASSGKVICELEEGPEPCKSKYPWEAAVTVIAIAEPGYEFVTWEGCDQEPATGSCEVEINTEEARTVTVTFEEELLPNIYTLKVKDTGTGTGTVTSSPSGISCGATCSFEFEEGQEVTLTPSADSGSEFVSWSGACSGSGACKVTMSAAKEVTATFNLIAKPKFKLTVKKAGTGTGTGTVTSSPAGISCGATCFFEFEEGKEVTLTATPEGGSTFAGWSGSGCSGTSTCKVTMSATKEVTATFNLKPTPQYTLMVQREGTGSGSVTSDPTGIECGADCVEDYPEGTVVTLTATAAEGSVFKRWSGVEGDCALERVCRTKMSGSKVIKAVFNSADSPPPPEQKGRARVVKRIALVRGGKALLDLRCTGGACRGGLKLTAKLRAGKKSLVIGRRSFSLSPGARETVQVRLSGSGKREVARHGKLAVDVIGDGVLRSTVKLKNVEQGH